MTTEPAEKTQGIKVALGIRFKKCIHSSRFVRKNIRIYEGRKTGFRKTCKYI